MKKQSLITILLLIATALGTTANCQQVIAEAEKAMENRNFREVIEICDRLMEEEGPRHYLLKKRGIAYQGLQDYENALASFTMASEYDTTDISLEYLASECLEQLGDINAAIAILEERFMTDNSDLYCLQNLARLQIKNRDYTRAIPYCRRMVDSFPSNFTYIKNYAVCNYQLGFIDIAVDNFRQAWSLNKRDLTIPVSLANCFVKMKFPERAIEILNEGLTYDSLNTNILKTVGFLYYRGESYGMAVDAFARALAAGDSTEFVRKHLGISLFNEERYQEAIPELMAFHLADTLNSEATYYLGLAMSTWHMKKEGIEYLKLTADLMTPDPEFMGSVWGIIGQTRSDLNQNRSAIEAYTKALEYDPLPTYMYEIARMYDALGKRDTDAVSYRKAIEWFEKFISIEEVALKEILEERNLRIDQLNTPQLDNANGRIKAIREELFFMGEISK